MSHWGIPPRLSWLRCLISCLFESFSGVLMFILGHTPSFFVLCLASFFGFFGTHPDHSLVLALTLLQYSLGFYPSSVLAQTILRYSSRPFSDTHLDSTHFSVLAQILLRYSPRFHPFLVLSRTFFRYSPGFYLFPGTRPDPSSVLTWIPPFFGTHPDPSPILTRILPLFSTHPDTISSPASCLDFLGFSGTHSDLIHFPSIYFDLVSEFPDLFQHRAWFPLVFSSIMSRFL